MVLMICFFITIVVTAGYSCGEEVQKIKSVKSKKTATKGKTAKAAKKKKVMGNGSKHVVAVKGKKPKALIEEEDSEELITADLAMVIEMRHWSTPDYTRIAVTLDREVKFESHQISQTPTSKVPSRIYIDLEGRLGPGVKDIQIGDGLLKTARIGQNRPNSVRVVLDVDSIKDYKVFTFSEPFRIIIDIKGERREEISRTRGNEIAALAASPKLERVDEKSPPPVRPVIGKIRRIVVDPGHGGHDPGAVGPGGTREKDVVLNIALKLARKLKEELGLDVILTRSTDVFLELQERTAIANKVGADLFVSIHANASPNKNTTGIETYYLNLAKTEMAAKLAAKENGTSLEKVSLLQAVLFDLMANYKLNDSAHLAEEVQNAIYKKVGGHYLGVRNLGVKQGPFYVLVGATMPSILVETSFLSNEREEERLKDAKYQEIVAGGIMEGIRGYIAALK